jgi:hypothetical protein
MKKTAVWVFRGLAVVTLIGVVIVSTMPSVAAADGTCGTGGLNWYGRATAPTGAGSADGAYITELMPASYHAGSDATSDEAAWVINYTWADDNYNQDYTWNGGSDLPGSLLRDC